MSGLTVNCLPGCGVFTEYFPTTQPKTTLPFLDLKTVDQNASLEADLLDLTSNLCYLGLIFKVIYVTLASAFSVEVLFQVCLVSLM